MTKEESPDGVSSSGGAATDSTGKAKAKGKTKKGKWKPLEIEIKSLKEESRAARGGGRGGRGGRGGERGGDRTAERQRINEGEEEREF